MAISNNKTFGLADQFVQILQDNQTVLHERGLDITNWLGDTDDLKNDAVAQTTKQDVMEAATKVQTKVAQDSVKLLYDTLSTRIDAVMGLLGKNTPAAKQVGRLRSSLIKQSKTKIQNKTDIKENNGNK
jgi:hypothetical protein